MCELKRGSIMAGITLHSENNETVTCVPNVFIDELMQTRTANM